jgi:hypothetical protein
MEGDEGDFFFNEAEAANGMDAAAVERLQALEDRLNLPSPEEFERRVADQQEAPADAEGGSGPSQPNRQHLANGSNDR